MYIMIKKLGVNMIRNYLKCDPRTFIRNNSKFLGDCFEFNSGISEQILCYENGKSSILYAPRQKLKSCLLAFLYVYTKIYKPNVQIIVGTNPQSILLSKVKTIYNNLPNVYRKIYDTNNLYEKTETYLFIDEFEYRSICSNDYNTYLSLFKDNKYDLVIANSTINDSLDIRISDDIDNSIHMKKIYTDPNQFGQEYLDKMYHILGEDDDIYRREVLLKRKSKL